MPKPSPSPSAKPRASYAQAVKSEPTDFHLAFSIGGHAVDLETTVYGAIHTFDAHSPESRHRNMWHAVYTVNFRKVPGAASAESARASPEPASRDEGMLKTLPASIPAASQQATLLQLLWVLHTINEDFAQLPAAGLAEGAFVNNKLTAKLNRQLEEPMIVASACLPAWAGDLPRCFPFLFPFDTRYTFLQSTAFGYARLMQKWVGQAKADSSRRDDNLGFLGRLQRQKVRISRDRMLESAYKVRFLPSALQPRSHADPPRQPRSSSSTAPAAPRSKSSSSPKSAAASARRSSSTRSSRRSLRARTSASGAWATPRQRRPMSTSRLACSRCRWTTRRARRARRSSRSSVCWASSSARVRRLLDVRGEDELTKWHAALMDSRIIDVHFSRSFMKLVLDYELPLTIASVKVCQPVSPL